jgi:exopolysaccharide biosynthesis polyprenyl glycosylphosphotransferase
LAFWGLAIFYVTIGRLILRTIRHELLRHRIGHQRLAVVGQNPAAQSIVELYKTRPILGYTVVKSWKTWTTSARKELERLQAIGAIDGILLAEPDLPKEQALDLIQYTESTHLTFRYLADLFAARFTNLEVSTSEGIPVLEVKRTRLDGWGRIFKRVFDLVVSALALLFLSPLMLLTAIAIKLDSRGPVFFRRLDNGDPAERVGEGGKPFPYFKFRSMVPQSHSQRYKELAHLDTRKGPLVKIKNDPRVTRVGRFIRKWSIDELPELFLVLAGRMSLVGPRPHLPEEVESYSPSQRRVLAIKPGITGMAQISGRSNLSFDDEVKLDTWYIENWSPALDLYILLKTPFAVLEKRESGD